jgi:hypothetical protein
MMWGAGDWIEGRSVLSKWDEKYKDQAPEWIKEKLRGGLRRSR